MQTLLTLSRGERSRHEASQGKRSEQVPARGEEVSESSGTLRSCHSDSSAA